MNALNIDVIDVLWTFCHKFDSFFDLMKIVKCTITKHFYFFVINHVFLRVFVFFFRFFNSFDNSRINKKNDIDRNNNNCCNCNDCNEFKTLSKFFVFESNVRIQFIDLKKKANEKLLIRNERFCILTKTKNFFNWITTKTKTKTKSKTKSKSKTKTKANDSSKKTISH